MGMREENVDNGKIHATPFTKAQASVQMPIWPSMGAWAAPGFAHVPASSADNDAYQAGQRDEPEGSKITGEAPAGWSNIDGAQFELDEPGTTVYRPSGLDRDGDWDND